ncbi:MAG: ABC transporter ATP-binding protein [Prevotella sp.]|nr:ABC transporter ATP-binding protein [Prevotella sp.]MDE7456988.1 ABC transporter ATP-binding protein [Prevotella sp.]
MMLELHNVTLGQQLRSFSLTVGDGQLVTITGLKGSGKTLLLRAILGFIPVDGGHISIDGELLTPKSAPYFRRQFAYVPQHLSLPDGYRGMGLEQWADLSVDERYLLLLRKAIATGKPLLLVDEPPQLLSEDTYVLVDRLLQEAAAKGIAVLAVNHRITQNQVRL